MVYTSNSITGDDRSFALNMMWVGLPGSITLLAGQLFGIYDFVIALIGGITSGTLIGLIFVGKHDEYFQRMVGKSASWACAAAGLWLFASIAPITEEYVTNHVVGLGLIAATFHSVLAICRIRGY
ncbi:hypothetical protein [Erythrobacter sp. Alg231-14]|uniref:hypothetical protein n=1 Tax=Erythrobacter sp. Alg231-14 TaxID=1922225 RepID=UPI000D54DCC1